MNVGVLPSWIPGSGNADVSVPGGDAYALQAVSYRWSELFNALWWFFAFAGLFGRYSTTQGNLTNSFQNKFLAYNNKKKMVSSIQRMEGKFPVE